MASPEQLEENGQYDLAYEEYTKLYKNNPKNTHLLERLGHIASILNKKDDAEFFYTELIRLDAKNLMAYEQLMDICHDTNRYKYYVCKGEMHVLQEQIEHAINDYKKAVEKAENERDANAARYILATLYDGANKENQAIDEYLKLIDSKFDNVKIYTNLAHIYAKTDFLESAIDTLEKAREQGYTSVNEELAKLYIKADDPQNAMDLTKDELLKIRCLMDMGKNDEAYSIMMNVRHQYEKVAKYHSLLAQYYYQTDDYVRALDEVNEYNKYEPNSPVTYQMKALIYEKQGDEFNSHINWAKFNYIKGDKDVGMNEYMIAYQLDNSNVELVTTIADLLDTTDKNHSVEFYERLLELNPKSKRALQKLAEFRERIGDYNEMLRYMDKLKELDPNNPYIKQNYNRIIEKMNSETSPLDFIKKLFRGTMG